MSNSSLKYGQQKKRQAIRQLQQSSKRLANSSRNPFTWSRDQEGKPEATSDVSPFSSTINNVLKSDHIENPFLSSESNSQPNKRNIFVAPGITPNAEPELQAELTSPVHIPVACQGKRNPSTKNDNKEQLRGIGIKSQLDKTTDYRRKKGVCMFMCPVAEFNKRQEQGIYSTLETEGGKFRHHLAVKEYQRSSADQEESQPDDLRPSIVLLKTVQYLFVDLLDKSCAYKSFQDLYDFSWNRTRAIRKDIIQQKLSDMATVYCLESIARFHILSAYLMTIDTPEGGFEHKYNNENLEKTVTSLRHLYTDISQACKNEAEFRMYYILLNINSGKIMQEICTFPADILATPYIRYAISCYNAYNSKNYVKFFKLFRDGPLLACCILYRYIYNVRQKAFVAIVNSHTTPVNKDVGIDYPLSKLMNSLLFKDTGEAAQFCEIMDIEVCDESEMAILKNRRYVINDGTVSHRMTSIDNKLTEPVGRIIFMEDLVPDGVLGGIPPTSPTDTVVNIFNSESIVPSGILEHVTNRMIAEVTLKEVSSLASECVTELQMVKEQSKIWLIHMIKELLDKACRNAIKEEYNTINTERKKMVNVFTRDMYYKDLYPAPLLDDVLQEIVTETLVEEAGHSFVFKAHGEMLEECISDELSSIVTSETALVSDLEHKLSNTCELLFEDMLQRTVSGDLYAVISETEAELVAEKKQQLKFQLEAQVIQKRYYFKLWKKRYSKIYAKKHTLDNITPRVGSSSSADVLKSLLGTSSAGSGITHISLTSPTKSYKRRHDVQKKLKMRMDLLEEADSLKGIPLKCFSTTKKTLYITLMMEEASSKLSKFLMDSLSVSSAAGDIPDSDYITKLVDTSRPNLKLQLLNLTKASKDLLYDACRCCHAVIIQCNDESLVKTVSQLSNSSPKILISHKKPSFWLDHHIQQPIVLTNIRYCYIYKELDYCVAQATQKEKPSNPPFKVVDIMDFTQSVVCAKITDILLAKQAVIRDSKLVAVDPNQIITFFNSIIGQLVKISTNRELHSIDWPNHFDQRKDVDARWNTTERLNSLATELASIRLPVFNGDPSSPADCLNYCISVPCSSSSFLISTVTSILNVSGVQWCLILNQIIHHIIENALFLHNYTVLLESQVREISMLNGENFIDQAFTFSDSFDELSEVNRESFELSGTEINEIWESLHHYESKLSSVRTSQSSLLEPTPVLQCILTDEYQKLDSVTNDLRTLSSSINDTELRLQSIVQEGALPSYLVKSLLKTSLE